MSHRHLMSSKSLGRLKSTALTAPADRSAYQRGEKYPMYFQWVPSRCDRTPSQSPRTISTHRKQIVRRRLPYSAKSTPFSWIKCSQRSELFVYAELNVYSRVCLVQEPFRMIGRPLLSDPGWFKSLTIYCGSWSIVRYHGVNNKTPREPDIV